MRFCPNCQTPDDDVSLRFCLQCGTPLSNPAQVPKTSGNAIIIVAILGGFLLLMLLVGGIGVYLFSRTDNEPPTNLTNSQTKPRNENERTNTQNNQRPSVEQLANTPLFPSNSANVNISADSSKNPVNAQPRIVASASSVRKPDGGNFYFPNFAFDNNLATAWCEGVNGAGVGEWLQFSFDREVTLKQIKIAPGYFKNDEAWRKNNRLARISVQFSDNSTREFSFENDKSVQTLDVGQIRTNWVKITIEDYFAGASDSNDTLISEVSFVTER